jgi:hypothetical protein
MYPNSHDVVPLAAGANLALYQLDAEELVHACRGGAIGRWASRWPEYRHQIERFAAETLNSRECAPTAAQLVIARLHGFAGWPVFAEHLAGLGRASSPIARFERAADAIVTGDAATLQQLLRDDPALVRARSTREHAATLLHYVAANGVENYRQNTPAAIVAIAGILLDLGAEVDAEAGMYGGGCTTLGLAATSIHPARAGVQNALMQTLLDHGASLDHPGGAGNTHAIVKGCLANGRAAAAEYLAGRGARLDLESAAGIGRLDLVAGYFDADGSLAPSANDEQLRAGFIWACEYGRTAVVELLLDRGVTAGAPLRADGQTGLHWAALGGHGAIVQSLLDRQARVDAVETTYAGTPLTWALFGWSNATGATRDRYYEVVALLIRAGATINPSWLNEQADRTPPFVRQLRADARMIAALRPMNP